MNGFGRLVALLAAPLNILAVLWVVAGSALWPPVDPGAVSFMRIVVGPVLVVGLVAATVLIVLQRRRHHALTTVQASLQIVLWAALFTLGLTVPTLSGGTSILLRLTGRSPMTSALSGLLWAGSTIVAWGVGVALLAVLIIGLAAKRQHVSASRFLTAEHPSVI